MKYDRLKAYLPVGCVFATTFAVYLYTLCPTVYWDDAGELIAACYTLGIPHPPGHPLYAIMGKLFTLIPVGSPAYRVNLMSAFFGALSCVVLFQVVRELIEQEERIRRFAVFGGAIAAFGAGFSSMMWDQSVLAETTTMHTFFMLIITLLAFRIDAGGPDDPRLTKRLLIFSFIYGLSFTNHVAGLFFAPSLAVILLYRLRLHLFRPGRLIAMLLLFFAGLSVYAYLPIASRFNPPIDWGNPETFHNFWWVVTARQYSTSLVRSPTFAGFIMGLRNVFDLFLSNMTPIGSMFALVGAVGLWRARKQIIAYGLIVIAILFATSLNSAFISVYLAPAVLILAIWAGFGVAVLCDYAERLAPGPKGVRGFILAKWAQGAAVLFIAFSFAAHFSESNMRAYTFARDYGVELLSSLPQDAVLITGSADPLFISWYLQFCEGYRTDVKVISRNALLRPGYIGRIRRQHPELNVPDHFQYEDDAGIRPSHLNERGKGLPWYANAYLKRFYELNSAEFPIFWEGFETNQLLNERFEPCGLVFQVIAPGEEIGSQCSRPPSAFSIAEKIEYDFAAGRVYGNHFFSFGVFYQWHNDMANAERFYGDAIKLYPEDSRALNNIGAILAEQGKADEAFEKFLAAFRLNPNDPASNHNVGQALLDRGKAREALPYFQRAMTLDSGNFEDYHSAGLCYSAVGKNNDAIGMFQKALEIKPGSPESLSSLGVVYLRLRETGNAEKLLLAAVEIEPENAENWYNLACLRAIEGDKSGAAESLKKALSLNYNRIYELGSRDSHIIPILESLPDNQ